MSPITQGATATRVPRRLLGLLAAASIVGTALLSAGVAPIAADQTSCGVRPIDLELIIDRSGSMNTAEGAKTRIGWAKEAAVGMINGLDTNGGVGGLHRVGLSTFGGTTSSTPVALGSGSNAATVNAAINAIAATGGTPFKLGMSAGAGDMTGGARGFVDGVAVTHIMVFLSDGNPDPDSYAPNATEIGNYAASADTAYAVAIGPDGGNLGSGGTGVSYALMGQIAKPAGAFRAVTSGSGLPNLFAEILQEINCPQIDIEKSATPTTLPAGGGSVTYGYTVTNIVQGAPLSNVTVTDDTCAPVGFVGGDANVDSLLQSGETWTYSCTMNLTEATTNVATAQGSYGGQTFTDKAEATVTVAEPTPPQIIPPSATHEVSCGEIEVTFTNATPWLYALQVEVDGALSFINVDGRIADGPDSASKTFTFDEDSGVHEVRYHLAHGAESDYFFDWTEMIDVQSDCKANPTPTPTPTDEPEDDDASLNVRKVDEEGNRLEGAVFTVDGMDGRFTTGPRGNFCITGLDDDSEWLVTEIQAPEGYEIAEEASQWVEVDDDGDCNSPSAVFVNTRADEEPSEEPSETPDPTKSPKPSKTPRESELGGTPTPKPSGGDLPDTSIGQPMSSTNLSPILALVFLSAIGSLVWMRLAGRKVR